MATSCSITIRHAQGTAAVYMSHDGSPDTALRVLVDVLDKYAAPTSEQLYDAYLAQYTQPESQALVASQSHLGDLNVGVWDYLLENGQLRVDCHEPWANGVLPVHPLAYPFLGGVRRSYQTEIANSICQSLQALESMDITLAPMAD